MVTHFYFGGNLTFFFFFCEFVAQTKPGPAKKNLKKLKTLAIPLVIKSDDFQWRSKLLTSESNYTACFSAPMAG